MSTVREMNSKTMSLAIAVLVAFGLLLWAGLAVFGPSSAPVAAQSAVAPSSSPTAAPAPAVPVQTASSPDQDECSQFQQVYDSQIGPLRTDASYPSVSSMQKVRLSFAALSGPLGLGTDQYSQTLYQDSLQISLSPLDYGAMAILVTQFETDLPSFIQACQSN